MTVGELLPLLLPLIALQVVLLVAGLYDLTRPGRRVRGGNRVLWAAIICLLSLVGPLLYFVAGREED
jgi:hypothetical protein